MIVAKNDNAKPQLHQSHLTQLFRCGEKFKRKYLLGHKEKLSTGLVQGIAMHEVAAEILKSKCRNDHHLPAWEEVEASARAHFLASWNTLPITLSLMEQDIGLEKVKEYGLSMAVSLAQVYYKDLAPIIMPENESAIEKKWVVECPGYPFDLAGTFDVVESYLEEAKTVRTVRDLKNMSKDPGQKSADNSEQFSFYALAYNVCYGSEADFMWMDCLIKSKKQVYATRYKTYRDKSDFRSCILRFERACEIIDKGAFAPASRLDWWCSAEFCGFAADGSCPFFNRNPKQFAMQQQQQQEQKKEKANGTAKARIISANSPEWRLGRKEGIVRECVNNENERNSSNGGGGSIESGDRECVCDGAAPSA